MQYSQSLIACVANCCTRWKDVQSAVVHGVHSEVTFVSVLRLFIYALYSSASALLDYTHQHLRPTILATPAFRHPQLPRSYPPTRARPPHDVDTTALTTAFAIACRLHYRRHLYALPFATLLLRATLAIRPLLLFRP